MPGAEVGPPGVPVGAYDFEDVAIRGELAEPEGDQVFVRPELEVRGPRIRRAIRLERRADRWQSAAWQVGLAGGDDAALDVRAGRLYDRAIEIWRRVLDGRGGAPGVHVRLGFLLDARGRSDEARVEWQEGLAEAPDGPLASHARLALAERDFDDGEVMAALEGYTRVVADPTLGAYAAYRAAWCHYNIGERVAGIELLLVAADANEPKLADEARRDVARFAAELPDAEIRDALDRACGPDPACLAELRGTVDRLREDLWLPPFQP